MGWGHSAIVLMGAGWYIRHLMTARRSSGLVQPLRALTAAGLAPIGALIAALAGFAMVKFFGVVFLGQPREEKLSQAHDAGRLERIGLLWLATGCILLGLFPNVVIALLDPVTRLLVGSGLRDAASSHGWWLLAPISEDRASYRRPSSLAASPCSCPSPIGPCAATTMDA